MDYHLPRDKHSIEYDIPKHEHYQLDGDSIAEHLVPKEEAAVPKSPHKIKRWLTMPVGLFVEIAKQLSLELAIGLFALPFLAVYYLIKGSDKNA